MWYVIQNIILILDEVCRAEPDPHECGQRWYWDHIECLCLTYDNGLGCCPDDFNSFESEEECMSVCTG